jgi:CheY-like chemotaxis protein
MSALRKVLVVDDDPVVGKSFNRVLSDKGYLVVTAENAHEALEQLRKDEYDVVYTDIKMPGMDGLDLAERVKARRPWTPVIIVTGYGSTANQERAKAVGVSAFLHKPLSPEVIEDSAAKVLQDLAPAVEATPPAVAEPQPTAEPVGEESRLKNIALFLAAPFIGLVYAVFMPIVGIVMLAWMGGKALAETVAMKGLLRVLKSVGMFVAAPFIGLAYIVIGPVVGIAMLAWIGARALFARH